MEIKDILYIHGITAYGNNHHSLEKQLNKMGYTFHHPDLPGHGIQASTETNNQYTFDDMLLFLKTYIKINIRDKPFIIMGHSMGGGLTLALYKNFKKQITRVILECPLTPAIFNQSERFSKIKFKDFLINISKYKKFIKDNWLLFLKGIRKWTGKDSYTSLLANIMNSNALNKIRTGLKMIDVPTLLIVGENDSVVPPKSTLSYVKDEIHTTLIKKVALGAKHNPFKDTPEQLERFVIDFLKKY